MDTLKLTADQRLESTPSPTAFDYGMAVAKVATIAFPFLAAGVTLMDIVTAPLRGKRFSDWCEGLRLRLNDLAQEVEGLTPEALATNDAFVSAFAQATQSALRTHENAKREALRNAVLNVSARTGPSEDKQILFPDFVDRFSALHLRILAFSENTEEYTGMWAKTGPGVIPVYQVICNALPDTNGEFQLVNAVVSELGRLGLIGVSSAAGPIPTFSKWITNLGEEFLRFIKKPQIAARAENGP
jgi:hypothetical protein